MRHHRVAGRGVLTPAAGAECGVSSGAAEFGDVAGAAARGWDVGADWVVDQVPAYVERDLRRYVVLDQCVVRVYSGGLDLGLNFLSVALRQGV